MICTGEKGKKQQNIPEDAKRTIANKMRKKKLELIVIFMLIMTLQIQVVLVDLPLQCVQEFICILREIKDKICGIPTKERFAYCKGYI